MLGNKGSERMTLVSSCKINKENRDFQKTDDFKNYIVLIKKVPHGMGINNICSQKHNV